MNESEQLTITSDLQDSQRSFHLVVILRDFSLLSLLCGCVVTPASGELEIAPHDAVNERLPLSDVLQGPVLF